MKSPKNEIRLLIVTRQCPFPGGGGSGEYLFDILYYLATHGIQIDCLWTTFSLDENKGFIIIPREFHQLIRIIAPGDFQWGRIIFNPWRFIMGILKKFFAHFRNSKEPDKNPLWNKPMTALEIKSVKNYLVTTAHDAVAANYFWMADVFRYLPADRTCLKVVITHEVWHRKVADFEKRHIQTNYASVSRDREIHLLSEADIIAAISEEDAVELRSLLPDREIFSAPKAAIVKPSDPQDQIEGRCLFVGSGYVANAEGMLWFLREIWPQVLSHIPYAHLHVCGTVCSKISDVFTNVHLCGRVENLAAEYQAAEVVIVPLRVGAGVKIKLVEALAYGKAIVTTSIGLQGLSFLGSDEVFKADDAAGFAAHVVQALTDTDLRKNIEKGAQAAAKKYLSPEICYRPLLERIREQAILTESHA